MLIPDIVGMTAKASVNSFDMTQVPHWYMYPPKMSYCDSLHEGVLRAEIEKLSQAVASVYVHIPFCGTKCSFCSLFTSPSQSGSTFSDYTNSLQREIENFSDRLAGGELAVPIVYFGGGTPALLPEAHLAAIVEQIHRHFDTASLRHCSVEFSPEVVDGAMAQRWRKHGFNRASLGIQTFDDAALKAMHRIHSGHDALTAVKRLADAGYGDINVDLIFGYAEQTSAQWYVDLETVLDSDGYSLYLSSNSRSAQERVRKKGDLTRWCWSFDTRVPCSSNRVLQGGRLAPIERYLLFPYYVLKPARSCGIAGAGNGGLRCRLT
jgi:coproporphyrinogen III oxidase-like Fe-S oxidoreductase